MGVPCPSRSAERGNASPGGKAGALGTRLLLAPPAASQPRTWERREEAGGGKAGPGGGCLGSGAALTSLGAQFGLERFKKRACERRCCSTQSSRPKQQRSPPLQRLQPGRLRGPRGGSGHLRPRGPSPPRPLRGAEARCPALQNCAELQKPAEPRPARHHPQRPGRCLATASRSRPPARAPWTPPRSACSCPCLSYCSWRRGAVRQGPAHCFGGAPHTVSASPTAGCCSGWTARTWGSRSCPPTSASSPPTCKCAPTPLRKGAKGEGRLVVQGQAGDSSAPTCPGGGGQVCKGHLGPKCLGPREKCTCLSE